MEKFRTVIWDFAETEIPDDWLDDLRRVHDCIEGADPTAQPLIDRITPRETAALLDRMAFYLERPVLPEAALDDRLHRLQALITTQQRAAQEAMVGREVQVLVEKPGRLPGQWVGKSEHLHAVHATGPGLERGRLAQVRITASAPNSLAGIAV